MPKKKKDNGAGGAVWNNRIVKYGEIEVDQALANPENWRIHPYEQSQALEGILDDVGIVQNVLVNLRMNEEWAESERGIETFIDGHLRATRALARKQKTLPATYVDLSPNEERKVLLALDSIAGLAKPDEAKLKDLFERAIAEDQKLITHFQNMADDLGMTYGGEKKEIVDVPPKFEEQKELIERFEVKTGGLWQLGDHRLGCGDSSDKGFVEELIDGAEGVLMHTDPPYMVDYGGNDRPGGSKEWAELYQESDIADKPQFLLNVFNAWMPWLRLNAAWIVWHAVKNQAMFEQVLNTLGVIVHQQIIWSKPVAVISYSKYYYRHEPAFFGWVEGHVPYMRDNFFAGKNSTVWEAWFDGGRGLDEVLAFVEEGGTLWAVDFAGKKRPSKNMHPTEKPIELFARAMRNHTRAGEVCFEPFSGSGSQILAGEKAGRRVIACDVQPAFVAVTLQRWVEATGMDVVRLQSGRGG